MAASLSTREIAAELAHCQVELPESALVLLSRYLELLLHWNRRINLTGLRDPHLIVRRLFGESLYLAQVVELRGRLVDVGSGAGFPGLALKLAAPDLDVTLVEARQRKCAFLREVVRECRFSGVDVIQQVFEEWARAPGRAGLADLVTTRAVARRKGLVVAIGSVLGPQGKAAFFGREMGAVRAREGLEGLILVRTVPIPCALGSVIELYEKTKKPN